MVAAANVTARDDMQDQIDQGQDTTINLDRMWRAVGSPFGGDPRGWVELAEPYLRGVAGYFRKLDMLHGIPAEPDDDFRAAGIIFVVSDPPRGSDWRPGDMGGTQFAAYAYGAYLDGTDCTG